MNWKSVSNLNYYWTKYFYTYIIGISVSDEIMSQTNPLFIVNNKTNVKYELFLAINGIVKIFINTPHKILN